MSEVRRQKKEVRSKKMRGYYRSPIGILSIISDGHSLTELRFVRAQEGVDLQEMAGLQDLPVFQETRRWLDLYFSGKKPEFTPPLKPKGTPFQQKVWRELLTIPYGETTTYGTIARRIGCRSAQAIGQAVHNNPIAIIIPCHRVIGSDGALTGYASGLEIKRQLLLQETDAVNSFLMGTTSPQAQSAHQMNGESPLPPLR